MMSEHKKCKDCKHCEIDEWILKTGDHCGMYPWKCIDKNLFEPNDCKN